MPTHTMTSAAARRRAAAAPMAASSGSLIDEGRCTHPRKSLPAPSREWSSALAARALSRIVSGIPMPDPEVSSPMIPIMTSFA